MTRMTRSLTVVFVGAAILWLGHSAGAQGGGKFRARLSPVGVEASTVASITGSGSVTAVLTGTKLAITGTFEGLRTPATVAHIHRAAKGIRGPALFDLTVSKATSGTISGMFTLTPARVEDLEQGRFYVQIHSEKLPDGNLWGWLLQ
jgi:hypothetical protein